MRFLNSLVALFLVANVCNGAVVQSRTYRNTEEILVPVTIIEDGQELKPAADLKTETIANEIAAAVDEAQNLKAVEEVVEAQRRLDEAIVEEEIKEAINGEQDKEIAKATEEQKLVPAIVEEPQLVAVVPAEASDAIAAAAEEPAKEVVKALEDKADLLQPEIPSEVVVLVETNSDKSEQSEGSLRQATQATPTQTSTQQNFVQQLIQNSPLGQFFNQLTGQNAQQNQAGQNDEAEPPAPLPTLPGIFNPVTAVQTAAQSVVNSTTQAFQGLQQFASNLGNQFQNTLTSLGGQQQAEEGDATTARPPGPIQQLVNSFIGNSQQAQPNPPQQGPFQGLLNIFQGNNRPQTTNPALAPVLINDTPVSQPEPEPEPQDAQEPAQSANLTEDEANNEVRGGESAEANDSFEDTVQPEELIVVNDDATQGDKGEANAAK